MTRSQKATLFLRFALETKVLRFGSFRTKAGRDSPYFFNAGLFHSGSALSRLGRFYADAARDSGIPFDIIFGPAYKGIPLAAVMAAALFEEHGQDVPYAFNRKEAKDHGEGGALIGAPLSGRVLVVDDVISAGTSVGESARLIEGAGARLAGVLIALDRMERGYEGKSAVAEVTEKHGVPVYAIATLDDLVRLIAEDPALFHHLLAIEEYRRQYGT